MDNPRSFCQTGGKSEQSDNTDSSENNAEHELSISKNDQTIDSITEKNHWQRCLIEAIQMIAGLTGSLSDIKNLSRADRHLYGALDCFLYQFDFQNKGKPAALLRWACENSAYRTVKRAIEYGVDVDMVWHDDDESDFSDNESEFEFRINEYGQEIAESVEWQPCHDITPLGLAARCGNVGMVSLLLQYGADLNKAPCPGKSAILIAVKAQATAVVEYLSGSTFVDLNVTSKRGRGLLSASIRYAMNQHPVQTTVFKLLFPLIDDPNEKGFRGITPLFEAVSKNIADVVSILLRSPKVDPNLIKGNALVHDIADCRATPLMVACFCFRKGAELLPFFRNTETNFNILDAEGNSALDYALRGWNWQVVQFLLEFGTIPFNPIDAIFERVLGRTGRGSRALCRELVLRSDMNDARVGHWNRSIREWAGDAQTEDGEEHEKDGWGEEQ